MRNILIINFEHYVQARNEVIERVVTFLGHAGRAEFFDPTTTFNGDDRLVATGLTQRFVHSRLYQAGMKPYVNHRLRRRLAGLLAKPAARPGGELQNVSRELVLGRLPAVDRDFYHQTISMPIAELT